jgi:hypothetical protein
LFATQTEIKKRALRQRGICQDNIKVYLNVDCEVLDWVSCIETQVAGSCEEGKKRGFDFYKIWECAGSKATARVCQWTVPHAHPLQSAEHITITIIATQTTQAEAFQETSRPAF